ncbi:hypothetical protein FRC00_006813, partial [Tulasnella sp. 408]
MSPATQNIPYTPEFKFPNPPDKFGQDGHFYRSYDALAQGIDDDMIKGLKEQLDTTLVFAGLFAAVNTAFLGLSLDLLFPDQTADTNALLMQNNMLLTLLFLLDQTIPFLLQSGLFIFFVSLVLYINALSLGLAQAVAVILIIGIVIFVVTGLFTLWDRFCPFHSALFSALPSWVLGLLEFGGLSGRAFLGPHTPERKEESPETLKAIALQRAICGSDDPETLLHTISNIIALGEPDTMDQ